MLMFALLISGMTSMTAGAAEVPDLLFFYSVGCEHCLAVKEEFLPGFLEEYGDDLRFVELEVSEPGVLDSLYALESRVAVPEADKQYPAVYFLGSMLEGEVPVRLRLPVLVESYLANPDSALAHDREVLARPPEMFDAAAIAASRVVHIAYFYKQGCAECSRASEIIDWLESLYGSIDIQKFDIADEDNKVLAMALGKRANVPENKLMSTPQFIIGDGYILDDDISRQRLANAVTVYSQTGADATWETLSPEELAEARAAIESAFDSFSLIAVAAAGLGDGINPCAFATILFLVSYLGMVGRKRNEILLTGLAFAAAVFVTYFLVGLGFFRFIESVANVSRLADIIFGATAALCFVFGAVSITDYVKARSGNTADMALQLPKFLKLRIHKTIRERARTESIIAGALVAGFTVSLLELACTGQIYLPTIVFMVGSEGYTTRALMYLLLYNVCFIIPLIIVFAVVYFGVSSKVIGTVMQKNVGRVKLGLASVFFIVGTLLAWTVLH